MDWTQLLSLAAYTTGVCYFFYTLNEKTIREWRKEHKDQIQTVEKAMEKNESHWREMFMHMSDRLDRSVEKK